MASDKIAIQVAKLEQKIEHFGKGFETMQRESKEERELFWKEFRSEQGKTNKSQIELITTLHAIRSDLKDYKKECDVRLQDAQKAKRVQQIRMGGLISVIAASGTLLSNIAIAAIKIRWGIA